MSDETTPPDAGDERRPPAPPTAPAPPPPADGPDEPEEPGGHSFDPISEDSWLDPDNDRHRRRRRRTEPTGPVDRVRRKVRRRWRRWRRHRRAVAKTAHWYRPRNVVLGVIALVILGMLSVLLAAYIKVSDIRRAPLLPVTATTASIGTNIVLLGSNGQTGALALDPATLVVQFIHISADNRSGEVIDLPRDLLLGSGPSAATVDSLYMRSGVVGLVAALQKDMGLTVTHVIQTSFAGYAEVTDDLGGVSIQTDAGSAQFSGAQAEAYAAAPNPTGGTIETGHRYQHWSKAMLVATLQPGVLLNPFTLWSVFSHTADNIVVDDTLDNGALISLLWHLKSLRPTSLHFFTTPNDGYHDLKGQHVLLPNPSGFAELSTAIRTDNLATIGLFQ